MAIEPLLGLAQTTNPSDEQIAKAKWLISTNRLTYQAYVQATSKPVGPPSADYENELTLILYNLTPENPKPKTPNQ